MGDSYSTLPRGALSYFPKKLVKPCILAGCPARGTVLDPFGGSMTTMLVAQGLNCKGIAIELNQEYIEIGKRRLKQEVFDFPPIPEPNRPYLLLKRRKL